MKVLIKWDKSSEYTLKDPVTKIGRASDCPIRIYEDVRASRTHCLIRVEGTGVLLEDSSSRNGTFVDDVPITGPVELTDGSSFVCGVTKFHVKIDLEQEQPLLPDERPTTS